MKTNFTTNEVINDLAKEMISKGFTIISPADPQPQYIYMHFMYQGKFGCLSYSHYQYSGSRDYVPQNSFGSGQGVFEGYEVTMNEVNRILQCRLDPKIQNYTTLESYLHHNKWQDLMITTSEEQYIVPKK